MYFGAHVKASGGVWTAVERGEALGVEAIQFFAGSPRTWKPQLYREADAARLLADAGIVRNRLKIEAAIANARAALPVIEEHGSLAAFFWRFRPEAHKAPRPRADFVAASPESAALAKDLKRRGFHFVGPTTAYSLMQAAGIVNDHVAGCCVREQVGLQQSATAAGLAQRRSD